MERLECTRPERTRSIGRSLRFSGSSYSTKFTNLTWLDHSRWQIEYGPSDLLATVVKACVIVDLYFVVPPSTHLVQKSATRQAAYISAMSFSVQVCTLSKSSTGSVWSTTFFCVHLFSSKLFFCKSAVYRLKLVASALAVFWHITLEYARVGAGAKMGAVAVRISIAFLNGCLLWLIGLLQFKSDGGRGQWREDHRNGGWILVSCLPSYMVP